MSVPSHAKTHGAGEYAKPTYPVKVTVTITVTYANNPTLRTVERGKASNDIFFYKDAFNAWTFKTGSL